jgi:hypothetical protein
MSTRSVARLFSHWSKGFLVESIANGLPVEVAHRIHPDWRRNEAVYWTMRDALLDLYRGQWIAFADGTVIKAGRIPVNIILAARNSGKHPFVTCVGHESAPCRMRRVEFRYDTSYPGEALPLVVVEFRTDADTIGTRFDRVIPDTGADASTLPWSDCQHLKLDPADGVPGLMAGVGQLTMATVAFLVWAHFDGHSYPCHLQADFSGDERILGRDVLNPLDILFRGPSGEIIVNP